MLYWEVFIAPGEIDADGRQKRKLDIRPKTRLVNIAVLENKIAKTTVELVELKRFVARIGRNRWITPQYPNGQAFDEVAIFRENPVNFRNPGLEPVKPLHRHQSDFTGAE